ncbi:MAG: GH116 family glycosyl-hydrolase [Fimbriimonadaceae bacterium]
MSDGVFPRRTLLKAAGFGAAAAAAPRWAFAGPYQAAEWPIPTDKKLSPEWIRSLTARGAPKTYKGAALNHIGMPVGGICCGLVYLSGDGRLWHWDIFNYGTFGVHQGRFEYKGQQLDSGSGASYLDPPKPESPFGIGFELTLEGHPKPISMDAAGWQNVTFSGRYPIGSVTYESSDVPIRAELEAFSPFVPLETDDSSLPVTVMRYRLTNRGSQQVKGSLGGWADNPVLLRSGRGETTRLHTTPFRRKSSGILFSSSEVAPLENPRREVSVDDFQHAGYRAWKVEGTAFGAGPIRKADAPAYQGKFGGPGAWMVNSHATAPGNDIGTKDGATGKLTSPPFKLSRKYLNFWIGGGNFPNRECLNLLVDGKVVASATGQNSEMMRAESFDVRQWIGAVATIEIIDRETGGWGHVNVGPITLADAPANRGPIELEPDFGTFALALLDGRDVRLPKGEEGAFGQRLVGSVNQPFELEPGESKDITFLVAWHFPNVRLGIADDAHGRHYKARFKDAAAVASYVAGKPALLERTREWVKTWYEDSTLPHFFLNRTMSSASTLATTTCYRLATGRFYAYEGIGCCAGTCTHVWHYAHSVARLFPALERDTRERVDLGVGFVKATGEIWFRAEFDHSAAVDGQAGTILRFLREHQMAPDDRFLKRNWAGIRKSIEFLISKDSGEDGLLKGPQGNTLDAVWYGESSWLSSLYMAALRAGQEMARVAGDTAFADHCRSIFARGQTSIDALYNGEYYFQAKDPAHANVWGAYDSCHVDQVFGQSWAWQVGLGRVLPKEKTVSALKAIWKYNFTPNIGPWREKHKAGRWYAIEGDAGLIVSTNPKNETNPFGDPNTWQNIYFTETWTGCEHQVAGHMIAEGLLTEGLSIVKAVDDRHDGNLRNPYNEIECSDHYTRAMSAFGPYVALTGFQIDGPAGYLGFEPRIGTPKARFAWIGAEGWGSFSRDELGASLNVRHGSVRLRSFKPGSHFDAAAIPKVRIGDRVLDARGEDRNGMLVLHLAHEVRIKSGETLTVS